MSDGPAGLYPITDPRHPDYVPPATTPTPAPTPAPTPTPAPPTTTNTSTRTGTSTGTRTGTSTGTSTGTATKKPPKEEPPKLIDEVGHAQDAVAGMPTLGSPTKIPAPAQRTVDPQELVEYRMFQMMKEDSPYTQQAMTNAMQFANENGLLNTSIAASAGLDAAIRSILPIAQQDATTLHGQALENQRAVNEFLMQDYLTRNQFKLTEFGAKVTTYNQGLEHAYGKNIQAIQLAWEKHQNALQRMLEKELAELQIAANKALQDAGFAHSDDQANDACLQRAVANLNARLLEIEQNASTLSKEEYVSLQQAARRAYDAEVTAC